MEENVEVPVEQTTTPEVKATEQVQKPEPKEKKYVPLDELIKERGRRRAVEDRLDALEKRVNENKPDAVRDIAQELGVDEEAAKKLHAVLSKYSGNKTSASNDLEVLSAKFQERVAETASQFEDWDEVKDEMLAIFNEKYARDPRGAFSQDPEDYYYKAIAKKSLAEKEAKKQKLEVKDKAESQSLAAVESGNGSSTRPPKKNIWTRERIKALSEDEYRKHLPEIQAALAKGDLA